MSTTATDTTTDPMAKPDAGSGPIDQTMIAHLRRALATLRTDMERIELCLAALESCTQPLPDYESSYRRTRIPAEDVRFS